MGIRGGARKYIIDLLNIYGSGVECVHLSQYRGKRIIIDWANIAHRFICRSRNIQDFINEFINLIHKFARERIELIFIFDGKPRDEKIQTIEYRKSTRIKILDKIVDIIENVQEPEEDYEKIMHLARRVININIKHITECKKLFKMLGVKYIHLQDIEADAIFKCLLEHGIADICFSGDMDILAYGCKRIIQDLNFRDDTIIEINTDMLITYLQVSQEQLLMAFILSGTDWNNGLKNSNFEKNLKLIKKYQHIDSILEHLEEINNDLPNDKQIIVPNRFDWQFAIDLFSENIQNEIIMQIQSILEQQKIDAEMQNNPNGFKTFIEYGKHILEYDKTSKYIKKFQQCIYWKYSFNLNLYKTPLLTAKTNYS